MASEDSEDYAGRMDVIYFSNEFPRDDLHTLLYRLRTHCQDRKHPILGRFIDEATMAIRDEITNLPTEWKDLINPFETIIDFVDETELRKGVLNSAIDGVLLCIVELGSFIGFLENFPDQIDFTFTKTCLSGLGIGLLASSAVSLSKCLEDIPLAGAEAVRLAFRLGVLVADVSQNLESRDTTSPPQSWAYVVPEVSAEEVQRELDTLHEKEKTPKASKIFISAYNETSVTVSGPPSRLQTLFGSQGFFRDHKSIALPVYGGLCHAGHIYKKVHVDEVMNTSSIEALNDQLHPGIPVFSTSTGRPYEASSAKELLGQIVAELLMQAIQWDKVVLGLVDEADRCHATQGTLFVFRKSLPVNDLLSAFEKGEQSIQLHTEDLIPWISEEIDKEAPKGPAQSKIAIVGMSCRLPGGADSTEKFWDILEKGLDVHKKIPADRFDVETHVDTTHKRLNTSGTEFGCFIEEPGLFDAPFFNMSPREAEQTDPMQRLILVTAFEALERAGFVPNRTPSTNLHRIGTFFGQASDDYREVNTGQEVSTYFIPGGCRAFGPGRINYFFKFSGPSFNIDTACSSSLAAIQAACTCLWSGEADTVVAGGTNVLTNSDGFAGLSNGHFLSQGENACKTWDKTADGYVRADAVGTIVMKRLQDAEADNDNILGVVLAGATNHSAEAVSITHPHAGAQSYLYRNVVNRSGVDPLDVNFVEMHGTGTQAGDATEIKSVTDVFAPNGTHGTKRRSANQPMHIGAVKANVGHSESAAGVTALIKVMLMMQKGFIPPHAGIKTELNPGFPQDMDKRNVNIPYEKTPWPQIEGQKKVAVVNNFSAAGGNTTLVIEEAPKKSLKGTPTRSTHTVATSAKSKVSLKGNIQRMLDYLEENPDISIADLAYTSTARRHHQNHRIAISASDIEGVKKQLKPYLDTVDTHKPIPPTGPEGITFAFTGQGASHKSCNIELFHDSPFFRTQMLNLDSIAQLQGYESFIPAIDGSHPTDHQHSPIITQLALVCTEIVLAKYWQSLGVKPSAVIGHSLGEYAALHVAGVLSVSDTIFLVAERARLLQEKCKIGSHKMMAVRAGLDDIIESAGDMPYQVACINSPKDTALSGTAEEMDALQKVLADKGYRCFVLEVAFAFHSDQVDPILEEYEAIAKSGVIFHEPKLPVISPLLAKVVFDDKTLNAKYMRRATREPVNFVAALEVGQKMTTISENTIFIEIGPHPVCVGFIKSTLPSVNVGVPSLKRDEDSWNTLAKSLGTLHCAGVALDWNEFHRPFERGLRLLDLPTYAWNNKTHWIQYNGDWALTKGNTFYDNEKRLRIGGPMPLNEFSTSTVNMIIEESIEGSSGKVTMQSDLQHPDFRSAAYGHMMNGCGVVTSSIHADICYTLGEYFYKKFKPDAKDININISNLEVHKGLVAKKSRKERQPFQVSAETSDIESGVADFTWSNVLEDGSLDEPFAYATIYYEDSTSWLRSWVPWAHLVQSRIKDLERMADEGNASRFSHHMAYGLFASNLVDYADKYRGMRSVVMKDLEAYADVVLSTEKSGNYTVPPFFIDSVAHLAGFIMNVSDAIDTKANFCVTPGWQSMRFAKPLIAGNKYRSYVKMIPTEDDPTVYLGDVYIFQDDVVIGMVGGIQFRRYPRVLINRFFMAPDEQTSKSSSGGSGTSKSQGESKPAAKKAPAKTPAKKEAAKKEEPKAKAAAAEKAESGEAKTSKGEDSAYESAEDSTSEKDGESKEGEGESKPPSGGADPTADLDSDSITAKALGIIAKEAGIDVSELTNDARFDNLGVDSLMSLVISEKFRDDLSVEVSGGMFLEYPSIGDLRSWLEEYYS